MLPETVLRSHLACVHDAQTCRLLPHHVGLSTCLPCCSICWPLQDVSGVHMLLAMPSADLRSSAAALVVNLLEDQGREAMTATADRLKVCF